MKNCHRLATAILLSLISSTLFAAPDALVQSVQMPAWLQRDGIRTPLAAGTQLRNNDLLSTGSHARVLLNTADGSTVKLGENATLALAELGQQRDSQPLFTALLNVAKGAFRFTTSALAKLHPREVTINVAHATIGIRGTDVWGKDGEGKGVVCLIEGKIAVTGEDQREFTMDQPLSFYEMPKSQPAKPVAPIDPEQLKKWALETEIVQGQGATVAGGKWKVVLLTAHDQTTALAAYDAWRNAGYAVKIVPKMQDNAQHYQLRIGQLPTRSEAASLAKSLAGTLGASTPEVTRW